MAKINMVCPFSGKLCEECPLYRGRHYFLCFCEKYRGHMDELGDVGDTTSPLASGLRGMRKFEIPSIKPRSAIDPFAIIMKEREEGGFN
jgi:hypothetical protein